MAYPSANRDEDVSEAPFAFRCDRQSGFGYGAHTCIGMVLAKIELQILLGEIVARVHSFELAGQPAWVETSFVGGLKRLPVPVVME